MKEIIDIIIKIGHICFRLIIALIIARTVLMIVRGMARTNFIPEEDRKQIEENKMNIDKDLEKYYNYKE